MKMRTSSHQQVANHYRHSFLSMTDWRFPTADLKLKGEIANTRFTNSNGCKIENRQSKIFNFFTLVELLIVIAIIAILAGLLLPALNKAKEASKKSACIGNMKQMVLALNLYGDDYNKYSPLTGWAYFQTPEMPPQAAGMWYNELRSYLGNEKVMICPSAPVEWGKSHYSPHWAWIYRLRFGKPMKDGNQIFAGGIPMWLMTYPSAVMAFGEAKPSLASINTTKGWYHGNGVFRNYGINGDGLSSNDAMRAYMHSNGMNCGFFDGHVEWLPAIFTVAEDAKSTNKSILYWDTK
jgi:prepilin-type processing-associated H-X9-DG protein/prepilin-type N-terminal cleavage/methylation domain-containing protein